MEYKIGDRGTFFSEWTKDVAISSTARQPVWVSDTVRDSSIFAICPPTLLEVARPSTRVLKTNHHEVSVCSRQPLAQKFVWTVIFINNTYVFIYILTVIGFSFVFGILLFSSNNVPCPRSLSRPRPFYSNCQATGDGRLKNGRC